MSSQSNIVSDVSGLNPIEVGRVVRPETISELCCLVRDHQGTISIGGGRFSMGGQIAIEHSLHIDMRGLNRIISFQPLQRTIRVEAGIRWREIQEFIDEHDFAIKIMQTYSNFTVGGSMSVNSHGRYIGQGPLILSIQLFTLVLASGEIIEASPTKNTEIYYGVIGGYGGLGIIAEVVLELALNTKIEQQQVKINLSNYKKYFFNEVRNNTGAIFHNADIYPPHYTKVRAITWIETDKKVTIPYRITRNKQSYAVERYFVWAITSTPLGKWRREYIIDPIIYLFGRVAFRNYEAGSYDVAELEPRSRDKNTYILQEYFVPVKSFDIFMPLMKEILQRYNANLLNISIRHSKKDPGTLLAWAKDEVFALVLYYKQGTSALAKNKVAIWTRELIDAVISVGGSYYLPYQLHATNHQFHQAYPRARQFFVLKRQLDLHYKFRNKLWEKYYETHESLPMNNTTSEFKSIFLETEWRDKFYVFLQNIYNIYPENEFHWLIQEAVKTKETDAEIYQEIQQNLPKIKPFLAELRFALPALIKQKKEMTRQTMSLLGEHKNINGYVEIGSTGRYISELRKHLKFSSQIYLISDLEPTYSLADIMERGQVMKLGQYIPLSNYDPIDSTKISDQSIELVTCYIGLHHAPLDKLSFFVRSIKRILRSGGRLIVRDHDVTSEKMNSFVGLVHTVFNVGLGVSWNENIKELRHFTSTQKLISFLQEEGFTYTGKKCIQEYDPSNNILLEFVKV